MRRFILILKYVYTLSSTHFALVLQMQQNDMQHKKDFCSISRFLPSATVLTNWGRVTHTCVDKLAMIGSDNGLAPTRRQAIIWTNARILLMGPLENNFSETLIETHILSSR